LMYYMVVVINSLKLLSLINLQLFQSGCIILYCTCCLAVFTFWCQKVTKNSALGKNIHKRPLLTPPKASPRSGTCSPLQAIYCFQGVAELVLCGYIRKFIPAQNFGQSSHNGLKTAGPPLDFSTVPFRLRRRITFAMNSRIIC
jgi:hypothetical protein